MQSFTIEEFQADFYNLLEKVENGKSIIVKSKHGDIIMLPYSETSNSDLEIFCDHDDGC